MNSLCTSIPWAFWSAYATAVLLLPLVVAGCERESCPMAEAVNQVSEEHERNIVAGLEANDITPEVIADQLDRGLSYGIGACSRSDRSCIDRSDAFNGWRIRLISEAANRKGLRIRVVVEPEATQ